jgi:hypothetical protein
MFFSFVEGGSVCPGAVLVFVPRGWVGKSHMVCYVHLFILPIHMQAGFEPAAVG